VADVTQISAERDVVLLRLGDKNSRDILTENGYQGGTRFLFAKYG
jgi:hypothetical protein